MRELGVRYAVQAGFNVEANAACRSVSPACYGARDGRGGTCAQDPRSICSITTVPFRAQIPARCNRTRDVVRERSSHVSVIQMS